MDVCHFANKFFICEVIDNGRSFIKKYINSNDPRTLHWIFQGEFQTSLNIHITLGLLCDKKNQYYIIKGSLECLCSKFCQLIML